MARSASSAKSLRSDLRKRLHNHSSLRELRTAMRRVREASTPEEGAEAMRHAQKLLDRAGRRRLVHPNKADRLKSRLSARLKQQGQA